MKVSTGFRNGLLAAGGSVKTLLDGKVIKIFGGPVPASADADIGAATLLVTITEGGDGSTGLTLEAAAVDGVIAKNSGEVWQGEVATGGTATFFRICTLADTNGTSTTAVRAQGTVALVGADMNISNPALVALAIQRVDYFVIGMPPG
jgi:hypothetical protein